LATFDVPTPVETVREFSRPALGLFGVLPKTGDAELVDDRGKSGWERLRTICAHSISAWRRQGDALWIDRHGIGINPWRRLAYVYVTCSRERERDRQN